MAIRDLNTASPEDVARVLRAAAEDYRASTADLQAAWQDDDAGRVWSEFAKILERAAGQCGRACAKHFR